MKLKKALKFQLYDTVRPVIIYYIIILAIDLCVLLLPTFRTGESSFGGMEMATMIFLFVAGLNSFRSPFGLFVQNGLSRRTLLTGTLITAAVMATAMAVVDRLLGMAVAEFVRYESFFMQFYAGRYTGTVWPALADGILWSVAAYLLSFLLGYFIGTLYYRMNRWQKVTVSVGVPVLLFVALPILIGLYGKGPFFTGLTAFLGLAFGLDPVINPYYALITFLLGSAALAGLSWLLIRRAMVRA